MSRRTINNWKPTKGQPLTELNKEILHIQNKRHLIPTRKFIETPGQVEGICRSSVANTGILGLIQKEVKESMSTAIIGKLVYGYTVGYGVTPAPLNCEGSPKSICTFASRVIRHGVLSEKEILRNGDIINVDVSTILDGYYPDASRIFMIGSISPGKQRLIQITKECLKIGVKAMKPFGFIGDISNIIQKHAEKNGFSVVWDLCGHGIGLELHEEPGVCHFGRRGTGILLIPGMVFTIKPMISVGTRKVFTDGENGWTVITEDELPSAQWEHAFLITGVGLGILTYQYLV